MAGTFDALIMLFPLLSICLAAAYASSWLCVVSFEFKSGPAPNTHTHTHPHTIRHVLIEGILPFIEVHG